LLSLLSLLSFFALGSAPAPDPARSLMAEPPAALAERLGRDPALLSSVLPPLGRALTAADPALASAAADYLAACARERSRTLARRGTWSHDDVLGLLTLQLVDPERFVEDAAFRGKILALLPGTLDPAVPTALRDELLVELNQVRGVDFAASEAVESAWGTAPRRSAGRRVAYASGLRFEDDAERPLAASVYSLPSFFFDAGTADAFLSAVRKAAPEREIVVLTDLPLRRALEPRAAALRLRLLETHGRPFSPWPRDPFSLVRDRKGGVVVLVRPNLQRGREEDAHMGAELVQGLPDEVDRAWGGVTWTEAPVPFHNGQILPAEGSTWITLHTLEPRILALLGVSRVPVETFGTAAGIDRYVTAARQAARELSDLWGRPVRFVHPLPAGSQSDLLRRIGGGAGYDLDSLVTLLPGRNGPPTALVADISAGRALLGRLPAAEWNALRTGWDLGPSGDPLSAALTAAQGTPRAEQLDGFLDLTAEHLAGEGFRVRRLPLLCLPFSLLRNPGDLQEGGEEFLLTWNNVVAETRGDGGTLRLRAEGFSSLLPSGDRAATEAFAAAGARLDLFPPLVRSVVLNGGYRCASNHVRTGNRR
jgi:hypothetical protein